MVHGIFLQSPNNHLAGRGCPTCAAEANGERCRMTQGDFLARCRDCHGDAYDYSQTTYVTIDEKVTITCPDHGNFQQLPSNHIYTRGGKAPAGCPKCRGTNFSAAATEWLTAKAFVDGINIQHAGNLGEYRIPNTSYYVDGFCHETKMVYEFLGSFWHGDPQVYSRQTVHPIRNISMGEIYNSTMKRLTEIESLGYSIEYVWEQAWRQNKMTAKRVARQMMLDPDDLDIAVLTVMNVS